MKGSPKDFRVGLTFDDVLLVPKHSPIRSRRNVSTRTNFTRKIPLNIPVVSANMDTVTEAAMSVAIARLGGIGVIHRFLTVEDQVSEVTKVKRSEGIVIEDPITLELDRTVGEAAELISNHNIGGIVVVDSERKVMGLLTRRDITFEENMSTKVRDVMTPRRELITSSPGVTLERAKELLQKNKIEKLPLIDKRGRLAGLITSKDIEKRRQFPSATKDEKGRLRVAAAIGVKGDYMLRAARLLDAGSTPLSSTSHTGTHLTRLMRSRPSGKDLGTSSSLRGTWRQAPARST